MKELNLSEVEVQQDLTLEPGQYLCEIIRVEDVEEKEYLKIAFDIADGPLKNFFARIAQSQGKWPNGGTIYKSYKQSALPWFKRFIVAVEKSNADYHFDFDEKKLVGKKFVGNFGIEEWKNDDGQIVESVKFDEARSIESWKQGKIKTPTPKTYQEPEQENQPAQNQLVNENDLPF